MHTTLPPLTRWQQLRWQILVPLSLVWLVLGGLGIVWVLSTVKADLAAQLLERARTTAQSMQYSAESANNMMAIQRFVAALTADPNIDHVILVAGENPEVIASNELAFIGKKLRHEPALNEFKQDLETILASRKPYYHLNSANDTFEYGEPLLLTNLTLNNKMLKSGAMIIHFRTGQIEQSINKTFITLIGILSALLLSLAAIIAFIIHRSILTPIKNILNAVSFRQQGKQAFIETDPQQGSNELTQLGQAINHMLVLNDEQSAQLQLASRALKMGVWAYKPATAKWDWDRNLYELFNASPERDPQEVRTLRMLPEDKEIEDRLCREITSDSKPFSVVFGVKLQDKTRYLMSAGQVTTDQWLGLCFDVTELKEAQLNAEAANRSKGAFLANMSHEIRTPMNAVLGFAQLLARANLNESEKEYLKHIQTAGDALLNLINDILDFSKIESGKLELENISFDLPGLINSSINLVSVKSKEKNINIHFNIQKSSANQFIGDPGRIRQVLLNLLNNAIKFTDQGEINIDLHITDISETRGKISLSISDTGIGMSAHALERLFQPFSQADISTTRRFGGTGLGLSISKRLIEAMGGEICVQSYEGKGSCFSIDLELNKAAPLATLKTAELSSKKILFIYENEQTASFLTDQIGDLPCTVESIHIDHFAASKKQFDLLVFDISDEKVHALNLNTINPYQKPCVLLSNAGIGSAKNAREAGFRGYLSKPFTLEQLILCLENTLDQSTEQEMITLHRIRESQQAAPRVLLVDDNLINLKVAQLTLQQMGCEVETAQNGQIAFEKAIHSQYNIVFMDCQMPVMDGYTSTVKIREHLSPEQLPIIALTASAFEEDRIHCLQAGMNDYMSKPFTQKDLKMMLNRWHIPTLNEN